MGTTFNEHEIGKLYRALRIGLRDTRADAAILIALRIDDDGAKSSAAMACEKVDSTIAHEMAWLLLEHVLRTEARNPCVCEGCLALRERAKAAAAILGDGRSGSTWLNDPHRSVN